MKKPFLSVARESFSTILLVLVIFGASRVLVQNVQIKGSSMLPTLQNDELVLVDTISYKLHAPQRGDIVILHPPVSPNDDYVKRVIGLPGDRIKILNGTVYLNGKPLSEPYIRMPHTYTWTPERTVPPGDLFVLGDNRDASYDSHLWPDPFLSKKEVIGRVMFSYWPLNTLHGFSAPAYARMK